MEGLYVAGGEIRQDLAVEAGQDRVSEILGHLIQVRNLSILIGAGASFHLGSPTIRNVTRDYVRSMMSDADVESRDDVDALLDVLISGRADLEAVLQKLQAALGYVRAFDSNSFTLEARNFDTDILESTYAGLNRALVHACELPLPGSSTEILFPHQEFFRRLLGARRTELPRLKVFTTNYDLVIEKSLDGLGVQYLDGFRGGILRQLDLSSYNSEIFAIDKSKSGRLVRQQELVHLYKIHGSLNWRRNEVGPEFGVSGIVQSDMNTSSDSLAVIYPTPAKDADVLGYPYSDLLRIFGTTLSDMESAVVIAGYGFADDHLNRLLGQALRHNPTLQILVMDPVGVLEDVSTPGAAQFKSSLIGRLAQVKDSRLSFITGESGAFRNVFQLLPDVSPESPVDHADASSMLSA